MDFRINADDQEAASLAAGKEYDPGEDKTRPELYPETDIHQLLQRYQPWELPAKETFFGEVDYSLDRHEAIVNLNEAAHKAAEMAAGRSADSSAASPSDSAAEPKPDPKDAPPPAPEPVAQ